MEDIRRETGLLGGVMVESTIHHYYRNAGFWSCKTRTQYAPKIPQRFITLQLTQLLRSVHDSQRRPRLLPLHLADLRQYHVHLYAPFPSSVPSLPSLLPPPPFSLP